MANILILDDETAIRLTLKEMLVRDGHRITVAENGQTALKLIATQKFELALLDLNLGDMTGLEVLAALRRQSPDTVAIMLTAYASLETAVEALRQGAHDYLFKPCQTVELRESIRQGLVKHQRAAQQRNLLNQLGRYFIDNLEDFQALLEEQTDPAIQVEKPAENLELIVDEPLANQQGRFLQQQDLIVDFSRHIITLDGHLLELSPTEFSLLAYLISEAPRVVSPQELICEVQGYSSERWEASETVRTHIYHIRQKIKKASGRMNVIRTVRGVGYTIDSLS